MRTLLTLAAAAALVGCASSAAERTAERENDRQRLATELAGLVPGESMNCLSNIRPQAQVDAIGSTLLYRVNSGLVYRNDTSGGCERVEQGDILVTTSNGSRLCRGDIGRTVDPLGKITTGSCALGEFVEYRRP